MMPSQRKTWPRAGEADSWPFRLSVLSSVPEARATTADLGCHLASGSLGHISITCNQVSRLRSKATLGSEDMIHYILHQV